jgi:hypothetical protein
MAKSPASHPKNPAKSRNYHNGVITRKFSVPIPGYHDIGKPITLPLFLTPEVIEEKGKASEDSFYCNQDPGETRKLW